MKTKTNPGSFARRKKADRQEIAAVGGAAAHMSPDEYARAYPKSKIARQKKKAIAHEWTSDEARAASLKRMPRGTSLRARKTDAGRYEYWVGDLSPRRWVSRQRVFQLRAAGRL